MVELKNYLLLSKDLNTDKWKRLPSKKDNRSLEIITP